MERIHTYQKQGDAFGVKGDFTLKLCRLFHDDASQTGLVWPGQMTSAESSIGHTVSAGQSVLSLAFQPSPVLDSDIQEMAEGAVQLIEKDLRQSGKVEPNAMAVYMRMMMIGWVHFKAKEIAKHYFDDASIDPRISVKLAEERAFEPFYCFYQPIVEAEAIMVGKRNEHSDWTDNGSNVLTFTGGKVASKGGSPRKPEGGSTAIAALSL